MILKRLSLMAVAAFSLLRVSPLASQSVTPGVEYLDWNSDGSRIAVGYQAGRVAVWDASQTNLVFEIPAPQSLILTAIQWSPVNPDVVAVARETLPNYSMIVLVINVVNGQTLQMLDAWPFVRSISWSPDGRLLAAAIAPQTTETSNIRHEVRVWDVSTGQITYEVPVPNASYINEIGWSPLGDRIAGASGQGAVLWNYPPPDERRLVQLDTYPADQVAWSPDGTRFASMSLDVHADPIIVIWNVQSGYNLKVISVSRWARDIDWAESNGQEVIAVADGTSTHERN